MAEIFGLIVGGIGAGSLAIQIIEKVNKFRALLNSIKDAPRDIHEMLMEVELTAKTLSEIENLYRREPPAAALIPATRTLEICQEAISDLRSLVEDLDICYNIESSKYTWKKLRAHMRKDKVKNIRSRAQRGLKPLTMINQVFFHSLQSKKLDAILGHTALLSSSETVPIPVISANEYPSCPLGSSPLQHTRPGSCLIRWDSITTSYWIFIGTIYFGNGKLKRWRKVNTLAAAEPGKFEIASWRLQFHPASWIKLTGVMIYGYKPFGNWQYTMTPYNVGHPDSPIFVACQKGELKTVRKLLNGGLASPFDLTPGGATPLHLAARAAAPGICKLLIERGADGNYTGLPGGPTPLMCLAQNAHYHGEGRGFFDLPKGLRMVDDGRDPLYSRPIIEVTYQEVYDTVRILVEEGQSDPMIGRSDACGNPSSALLVWCGPPEPFSWLLRQDHVEVDLEGRYQECGSSIYHRLAFLSRQNGPNLILDALWNHANISKMTTIRDNRGDTVLHCAVRSLCSKIVKGNKTIGCEPTSWYKLVRGLLQGGSDVHAQNNSGETPLDIILTAYRFWWLDKFEFVLQNLEVYDENGSEAKRHSLVRWWLTTLADAGFDIKNYGRKEQFLHPGGTTTRTYPLSDEEEWDFAFRFIFTYDEGQNDLEITWEEVSREKKTPMKIPGSWF